MIVDQVIWVREMFGPVNNKQTKLNKQQQISDGLKAAYVKSSTISVPTMANTPSLNATGREQEGVTRECAFTLD